MWVGVCVEATGFITSCYHIFPTVPLLTGFLTLDGWSELSIKLEKEQF